MNQKFYLVSIEVKVSLYNSAAFEKVWYYFQAMHSFSSMERISGRNTSHIQQVLGDMFKTLEQEMAMKMQEQTLGDCIDAILMREQKSI